MQKWNYCAISTNCKKSCIYILLEFYRNMSWMYLKCKLETQFLVIVLIPPDGILQPISVWQIGAGAGLLVYHWYTQDRPTLKCYYRENSRRENTQLLWAVKRRSLAIVHRHFDLNLPIIAAFEVCLMMSSSCDGTELLRLTFYKDHSFQRDLYWTTEQC